MVEKLNRIAPRKLKVCITTWAPFVGGAEIGAERVAQGLMAAGHEVVVVVGQQGAVLDRFQGLGLRCVYSPILLTDRRKWWSYWRARSAMRALLRRESPDVIHSNDLQTHQMVSDAARGLGIPRLTYHKFPFDGVTTDWLNKYGAERHLFVSQGLMDEMCHGSVRLRESSRAVVNDGMVLPPLPTTADRQAAREALGVAPETRLVILVGQIIERKGVAELLHAWSRLSPQRQTTARLVLLGNAPAGQQEYEQRMHQLAKELQVDVYFAGFQNNVSQWLTAADVMVLPSHADPLPLAIMEAMACGLPVIGSAVTGIPEMVAHEETGLLVPPREVDPLTQALDRTLADDVWRCELGRASRRRCEEKFDIRRQIATLEREYRALVVSRGSGVSSR